MPSVEELIEQRTLLISHLTHLRNLRQIPTFTREQIEQKRAHAARLLREADTLEAELNDLPNMINTVAVSLDQLNTQIRTLTCAAKIEKFKRLMAEKEKLQ